MSEAALPKLGGKDKRSHRSTFHPFPFNLFKLTLFCPNSSALDFFPQIRLHPEKMMANRLQVQARSQEPAPEEPEAELTALVTSISWTFSKDIRSKNASFPFPSSFLTDVPVMRSLSSGLKQQSVLTGIDKHQQFKNPKHISQESRSVWKLNASHCKVVGEPRGCVDGLSEVPDVPHFERVIA